MLPGQFLHETLKKPLKFQHGWTFRQAAITTSCDAYTHIHKPKYILKCIHRSNSVKSKHYSEYLLFFVCVYFFALHINEKRCS